MRKAEAAMSTSVRRILEPCSSPEPAQPSWMDLPGSTTQQQMIEALETARREAGEPTTQMIDEHESSQDLGDAQTPPRKVRKKDADTPEVATPPSLKRYSLERQRQWYRKKLASLEENLGQTGRHRPRRPLPPPRSAQCPSRQPQASRQHAPLRLFRQRQKSTTGHAGPMRMGGTATARGSTAIFPTTSQRN